jgi:hypothetical protein
MILRNPQCRAFDRVGGVNHATNFSRTGEEGFKSLKLRVQVNGRAEAVQASARKFFADHVAVHESEDGP